MDSEVISRTATETWNFLRANSKELFLEITKVQLLAMLITIVTVLLLGVVLIVTGISINALGAMALPLILGLLIVLLIGIFFASVANSMSYNVVDCMFSKKPVYLIEQYVENVFPMLKYVIVVFIIEAIVTVPFLAVLFFALLGTGNSAAGLLLAELTELVMRVALAIVDAILYLLIQFAIFELLIARRGVIESFQRSFSTFRRKPLETAVFSLALWAVESAVMTVFIIPLIIVLVVAIFGGVGVIAVLPVLSVPILIIGGIIFVAFLLLATIAETMINVSARYVFWNKIKVS